MLSSYRSISVRLAALALLVGGVAAAPAPSRAPENWPQFRGPDALPVSDNPNLPSSWSRTDNVEWVTEIPGTGWSS
ncbi:MAG: pyrrolo-quinoline quinone, partial [Acidobacteriota bacterium]